MKSSSNSLRWNHFLFTVVENHRNFPPAGQGSDGEAKIRNNTILSRKYARNSCSGGFSQERTGVAVSGNVGKVPELLFPCFHR